MKTDGIEWNKKYAQHIFGIHPSIDHQGDIDFAVRFDMPTVMRFVPSKVLQLSCTALNARIVQFARTQLTKNLLDDFYHWSSFHS